MRKTNRKAALWLFQQAKHAEEPRRTLLKEVAAFLEANARCEELKSLLRASNLSADAKMAGYIALNYIS